MYRLLRGDFFLGSVKGEPMLKGLAVKFGACYAVMVVGGLLMSGGGTVTVVGIILWAAKYAGPACMLVGLGMIAVGIMAVGMSFVVAYFSVKKFDEGKTPARPDHRLAGDTGKP